MVDALVYGTCWHRLLVHVDIGCLVEVDWYKFTVVYLTVIM